jgi:predicted dehydrogenase
MTKNIGWGILGCGKIARKFAADLKLVNNASRIAVASRDQARSEKFAQEFGFPAAYGSYEELVQDKNVDVIYIATPHSHHHAHTMLCLNNGKAVLCEKAFAVNVAEAKEMISLAREKKLFLMEALWSAFLPHIKKLRELLKEKKVGEINSVLANFGFRPDHPVAPRLLDPALAGGTLLDIGIYNVFIAMEVLGRPDTIDAVMISSPDKVDEQLAVTFRYKDGKIAQLFSTFLADLPTIAHISGSKGRLELTHRFYAPEATIGYYPGKTDSLQNILVEKPSSGFGYQYETQHVTDCLLKGLKESPEVTFAQSLIRMEVLDEIRKKAGIYYPADTVS